MVRPNSAENFITIAPLVIFLSAIICPKMAYFSEYDVALEKSMIFKYELHIQHRQELMRPIAMRCPGRVSQLFQSLWFGLETNAGFFLDST